MHAEHGPHIAAAELTTHNVDLGSCAVTAEHILKEYRGCSTYYEGRDLRTAYMLVFTPGNASHIFVACVRSWLGLCLHCDQGQPASFALLLLSL